jgi:mannose-6-phosphate isomerase
VNVLRLPANQPHRFYRGGEAIARFRGTSFGDDHAPEDWIGSTTALYGEPRLGLSTLESGQTLRDYLMGDGAGLLPPGRADTGVLVKLLDAGERLPVHFHPAGAFARQHLGEAHGKTEAWLIVEANSDDPAVALGFAEEMPAERLADWVRRQDVEALLGSLNRLPVAAGDVVFVPAGIPHAIGTGIFMVEVQEPSDLSVLLEWQGFALDPGTDPQLGLPLELSLEGVDRSAWTPARLDGLRRSMSLPGERVSLLPPEAAPFFGAERLRPEPRVELEPALSIFVVVDGAGTLETSEEELALEAGETLLVGFGAGPTSVSGPVDVIRCTPPELDARTTARTRT